MAARDRIIDFSEFDPDRVVADLEEIRRYNPQRAEMEQLTAIVHEDRERHICVGYKDITESEFWIRGHMPALPLMPGVVMCEAAAQLCSYYARKYRLLDCEMIGFGGLDGVRFREFIVPGNRLLVVARLDRVRARRLIVSSFQGFRNQDLVVEGQIIGIPLPVEVLRGIE